MDNEAWIIALEIAADALYRQDGGINAGEGDWRNKSLFRSWVAIRKEIQRLENAHD